MFSHRQVALHNPFGNVEVAVDISLADRQAAGSVDGELHAAAGVAAAPRGEEDLGVTKYCPRYKHL